MISLELTRTRITTSDFTAIIMIRNTNQQIIDKFLDNLWLEKGLADNTLSAYRRDLGTFSAWLQDRELDLLMVTRAHITRYLSYRVISTRLIYVLEIFSVLNSEHYRENTK